MKLPQNLDAERAILGAALLDRGVLDEVAELLEPHDFFHGGNRAVWSAMLSMGDDAVLDTVTLCHKLEQTNEVGLVGGMEGLAALTDRYSPPQHARHHAAIVAGHAAARRMVLLCRTIADEGCEPLDSPTAWVASCEERLLKASTITATKGYEPISGQVHEVVHSMCGEGGAAQAARMNGEPMPTTGLTTGFSRLDQMTGGLQPSDLIIIAARPSMGKTALAMNLAAQVAKRRHPVLVFSMEMSTVQLIRRVACTEARVDAMALRDGTVGEEDYQRLLKASGTIYQLPIAVDERPALSITAMRSAARRWRKDQRFFPPPTDDEEADRLGLVVVDYLQLAHGEEGSRVADTRNLEIGEVSSGLKAMAKELGVPVLALSQLNRGVDTRPKNRPMLSDLRDSGAIEQDADVVGFIYREARYDAKADPRIAELNLAKQRNGPIGRVPLVWTAEHTLFQDPIDGPQQVRFEHGTN
jgi:replicative DNA helicase